MLTSVAYLFERKGLLSIPASDADGAETVVDAAIEAGAEDVSIDDGDDEGEAAHHGSDASGVEVGLSRVCKRVFADHAGSSFLTIDFV